MHRVDSHIAKAHRADKGAEADERVARILAGKLPNEFFVINDLAVPFGNIDHVVISRPGGVSTVETKSAGRRGDAPGGIPLLDGAPLERDPVQQAPREAMWVKERIRDVNIASLGSLDRVLTTLPSSTLQRDSIWKTGRPKPLLSPTQIRFLIAGLPDIPPGST
jgi:hypothetical protein